MYAIRLLEEGGGEASQMGLVFVILFVFLVVAIVLGWWVSKNGWLKQEEEPVHTDHGHAEHGHEAAVQTVLAHAEPAPAEPSKTESHPAPAAPATEDLTVLEGIGPKVAQVLAEAGITTFEGLAKAEYDKVKAVLDAAGYKYMDPAGWIEQAALAARGDTEGLKKLQESLKGGRKSA